MRWAAPSQITTYSHSTIKISKGFRSYEEEERVINMELLRGLRRKRIYKAATKQSIAGSRDKCKDLQLVLNQAQNSEKELLIQELLTRELASTLDR